MVFYVQAVSFNFDYDKYFICKNKGAFFSMINHYETFETYQFQMFTYKIFKVFSIYYFNPHYIKEDDFSTF